MAVNICWTFGYGNREDYDLADRFESTEIYINPHSVVSKIREIRKPAEETKCRDECSGKKWFGVDIENVDMLYTRCKPNSSHLIWMDKYCGEWFSVREIKWN